MSDQRERERETTEDSQVPLPGLEPGTPCSPHRRSDHSTTTHFKERAAGSDEGKGVRGNRGEREGRRWKRWEKEDLVERTEKKMK